MLKEKEEKSVEETEHEETIKTIAQAVTPEVIKYFEENKPVRKNIFEDGSANEQKELSERKQEAAEFLKAVVKNDGARVKALSSGTTGSGADLVPTLISDDVILQAQKYGLVRQHAMNMPMNSTSVNVPTFTTATAYRTGTDTAALSASQPTTGSVNLRAKTLAVVIPISKMLLEFATPNVVDILTLIAGRAIAKYEDEWAILGKASGEGVFQNASVPVTTLASTNTTYASTKAEDLLTVLDNLDENFVGPDMRWLMSLSMLNNLRRIRSVVGTDKQGFLLENLGGQLPATLWDLPFDTSAIMPKNSDGTQNGVKYMGLIDWSNVIHGDAKEYTMQISDQATILDPDGSTQINLWQQNMVAIKICGWIDIQIANANKAFGVLKTAAS